MAAMNWISIGRLISAMAVVMAFLPARGDDWPMFRGQGNGVFHGDLPVDLNTDTKIWHSRLDGHGQSSPVALQGRVYTTATSTPEKSQLKIFCHDLKTGRLEWSTNFSASRVKPADRTTSIAAPTPCLNESRLYALFENGDVAALNHSGELVWRTDLGKHFGELEGNHGQGASPLLTDSGLVVVMDHLGTSYMASLDPENGSLKWKTERETGTAWSSPVIAQVQGSAQIITSASGKIAGYNPENGHKIWEFTNMSGNTTPSPAVAGSWVAMGSSRKNNSRVYQFIDGIPVEAWRAQDAAMGFASPLVIGNQAHFINKSGILFSYELESGQLLKENRLVEDCWASPIANNDYIWFFHQKGSVTVVSREKLQIARENPAVVTLDRDDVIFGAAACDGTLILRHRDGIFGFSQQNSRPDTGNGAE